MTKRLLALLCLFIPGVVSAVTFPNRAAFDAAMASQVTETFDGYATGLKGGSFALSNATVTSVDNLGVFSATNGLCGGSQCLSATSFKNSRTFGDFVAGTTGFAFDFSRVNSADSFSVEAVTGNGTEIYALSGAAQFFGLTDDSGITSVTIKSLTNTGSYNNGFSFDNVTTGTALPQTTGRFRDREAFLALAPGEVTTETFASVPTGLKGKSLKIANATITSPDTLFVFGDNTGPCGASACLGATSHQNVRTFDGFANDTIGFSFDFGRANYTDSFSVVADTASGTQSFSITGEDRFFALIDQGGIRSVSVTSLTNAVRPGGRFNNAFSFDNVTTFGSTASSAIPEPATWAFLVVGMACASFALRRPNGHKWTTEVAFRKKQRQASVRRPRMLRSGSVTWVRLEAVARRS